MKFLIIGSIIYLLVLVVFPFILGLFHRNGGGLIKIAGLMLLLYVAMLSFLNDDDSKAKNHIVSKDYKYELKHYEKLANGDNGTTNAKKDYKYYVEYLKNQKTKSKEFEDEDITEHIINNDKKPYIAIHYRKWSNDKDYRLMNVDIYRHKK